MKKTLASILLSCMVISLCACGSSSGAKESQKESQSTESQAKDSQTTESQGEAESLVYTIKLVDEAGNPMSGVMVQICNGDGCSPALTNADGIAEITVRTDKGNKASVSGVPEGYEYTQGEVYFEDGEREITLTVQAVK